ncbi:MAG: hypothetical protein KAR19_05240 [Bacteroidales bacterium]|nr:hypothetical protein [Bacteroidales bacterium]
MIAAAIDDNYGRIKVDLISRGLTCDRLIDDLLDHVCCMVEEDMNAGSDFDSSYDRVLESIGEKQLYEIQHQTLLLLDKKFQRMKNFTYLFGLSSALIAIVGAFFKKMHWPGAGILITVGIALVVLVFLPLYFIVNYREQTEKKNPIYAIVGYLTMALLLAAALFKIQHWPGAGHMIEIGLGFLIIGFIPLYVVNVFQRGGKEKISLPYVAMLLVGISIVMLFTNVNMSKYLLDTYMKESVSNEARVEATRERTAHLMEMFRDSAHADNLQTVTLIHEKARSLQIMIAEMQEGMIAHIKQPGVSIEQVRRIDNRGAGREAIVDTGSGGEFAQAAIGYREMLEEMINDPVTLSQIEDHLEFTGKVWPHEYGARDVANGPLMKNYYKLTDASKGIALSEYVTISYLLHH